MEPFSYTTTTTASATTPAGLPSVGFDLFSVIASIFSNNETAAGFFSSNGILGFLDSLWNLIAVTAYILTIIMLVFYVFASVRRNLYMGLMTQELRDAEKLYEEQHSGVRRSNRLADVYTHSASDNPNDWKLAIIEADIILDDTLKRKGFVGNSLGERLKSIGVGQLDSLNDAWEAHKIRNRIAHDGADFVLTKRIAEETISKYKRVLSEFGII